MNDRLITILVKLRSALEALYGQRLAKILVYGSQARGDARPWSDVDVAVVLDGPVDRFKELHRTEQLVADLSLKFDTVIHCKFLDREALTEADQSLAQSILREGIAV